MKTKQNKRILYGIINLLLISFLVSCEGPEGPKGDIGLSGNGTCGDCHNTSTLLKARIMQYENSTHLLGGHFERSTKDCGTCHTNEGFHERLADGMDVKSLKKDVENPTPPNCRTCHNIHKTNTEADLELTTTAPVKLWLNGATVDFGKGNLCVNCHQPRVPNPLPVKGGPDVVITSATWGPHYGAQAPILAGTGGYEFTGSMEYKNSPHGIAVADGCVGCHMQTPFADKAGGHTMEMSYTNSSGNKVPILTSCQNCHNNIKDFNVNLAQTIDDSLLVVLKTKLVEKNLLDPNTERVKPGTYNPDLAGAVLNFLLLKYEGSKGVHNTKYSKALLTNTIEFLNQ